MAAPSTIIKPPPKQYYYYIAPGGGYSTGPLTTLIGKDVREVFRDGVFYRLNAYTFPNNKEFNFNNSTGEVSFSVLLPPLQYQEKIIIKYTDAAGSIGIGSGSHGGSPPPPPPPPPPPTSPGGGTGTSTAFQTMYWTIEGVQRSAMVWQPSGSAMPILFAWHGRNGTGTGFSQKHFERYEFAPDSIIVVYPTGLPTLSSTSTGWQHSVGETNPYTGITDQDLKFYDAMLSTFNPYIDTDFIFNHGFSNGGEFVYDVLWVARESTLESICCSSAILNTTSGKSPLPVMHTAGLHDPLVSFTAQQNKFNDIKTLNGCSGSGTTWASGANGVIATEYACSTESVFLQYDGLHSYPANVPALISKFFNQQLV